MSEQDEAAALDAEAEQLSAVLSHSDFEAEEGATEAAAAAGAAKAAATAAASAGDAKKAAREAATAQRAARMAEDGSFRVSEAARCLMQALEVAQIPTTDPVPDSLKRIQALVVEAMKSAEAAAEFAKAAEEAAQKVASAAPGPQENQEQPGSREPVVRQNSLLFEQALLAGPSTPPKGSVNTPGFVQMLDIGLGSPGISPAGSPSGPKKVCDFERDESPSSLTAAASSPTVPRQNSIMFEDALLAGIGSGERSASFSASFGEMSLGNTGRSAMFESALLGISSPGDEAGTQGEIDSSRAF